MKYKVTIEIEATDANQASEIAKGLSETAKKVNGEELHKMLKLLAKNPTWITMAKSATKFMKV